MWCIRHYESRNYPWLDRIHTSINTSLPKPASWTFTFTFNITITTTTPPTSIQFQGFPPNFASPGFFLCDYNNNL